MPLAVLSFEYLEPPALTEADGSSSGREFSEGLRSHNTKIDRPVVHVEIDVLHQHAVIELLGVGPHRGQRGIAVGAGEEQRLVDHLLDRCDRFVGKSAVGDNATQRQRTARFRLPASAEVFDEPQALLLPCEASLVDTDPKVGGMGPQPRHDF